MNILPLFLAIFSLIPSLAASTESPVCQPIEPTVKVAIGESVEIMSVEDYVAGVVAGEVPYTFEGEAMKAQAVAARTYLYYRLENGSPHKDADICTDASHCCAFMSEDELVRRYGEEYAHRTMEKARGAAESTYGEILTYKGSPIQAVWHSSSDGYTEDSGNIWLASLPYLSSVSTPERAETYAVSFTLAEVKSRLRGAGYRYDGKTNLTQYNNETGRCDALCFGNAEVSGNTARKLFGLKSTDFTAGYHGGRLYFLVRGYGHGVGMSQHGANVMAKGGSSYDEILSHYYKGSELSDIR